LSYVTGTASNGTEDNNTICDKAMLLAPWPLGADRRSTLFGRGGHL
jgi:hypothetical protein